MVELTYLFVLFPQAKRMRIRGSTSGATERVPEVREEDELPPPPPRQQHVTEVQAPNQFEILMQAITVIAQQARPARVTISLK